MSRRLVVGFLALVTPAITLACGTDEYRALVPGECLPATAEVVGVREPAPPTVRCTAPHRYEVYGTGEIDGAMGRRRTFPPQESLDAAARQVCYELFEPNVGIPAAAMGPNVKVVYLAPSSSSWEELGDRDVECLLVFETDRRGRFAEPSGSAAS